VIALICNLGESIKLAEQSAICVAGLDSRVRGEEMRLTHSLLRDSLMALISSLITPKNFPVMELKIPCSCS
jgi:hypothetical protein